MRIPFGKPIIDDAEKQAVADVLSGPVLVHGPHATEFEQAFAEFTGAPEAISVSSCTAGMHLIYFTLGLGVGDEVIVPAMTHIATAHAVELTGAKPIFVDAELKSGNIAIEKIEEKITARTKAIAVVHYLGVPVDMPAIVDLAHKHNLYLLEDCALAPGAKIDDVHVGLHGDAGAFSFYPVKHLTTAEGGMVILKDSEMAAKLRLKKAFGVDRTHGERKIPGVYDTIDLGFNYRMSEIHAAIGIEQMKKLPDFLLVRRKNFETLENGLKNVKGIRILEQPTDGHLHSCHYCMGVILEDDLATVRPQIMQELTAAGIGSSVYYPQPVPRMTYYKNKYGYKTGDYPAAALISDSILALPVGPHLNEGHMQEIAEKLIQILEGLK